jgi:hypothetical protein
METTVTKDKLAPRILRWFAIIWFALAGTFIILSYMSLLYFQGHWSFIHSLNPFDITNHLTTILILSPGIAAWLVADEFLTTILILSPGIAAWFVADMLKKKQPPGEEDLLTETPSRSGNSVVPIRASDFYVADPKTPLPEQYEKLREETMKLSALYSEYCDTKELNISKERIGIVYQDLLGNAQKLDKANSTVNQAFFLVVDRTLPPLPTNLEKRCVP